MECLSIYQGQRPLNIVVIGLGQRTLSHTIKFLLDETVLWNLVAVCDSNAETILSFRSENPTIRCFQSISQLLAHHAQAILPSIDCAFVAVPHSMYAEVIPHLLRAKIYVRLLKEKPAGSSTNELQCLQQLAFENSTRLVTAGQSRYGSRYARLQEWIPLIGKIYLVEGTRKLFVSDLGVGWRAAEGNGALGDLGWHLINDALGLTNTDTVPHMKSVNLISVRKHQAYKCEDSACIHFNTSTTDGNNESHEVLFNLNVSRVGHEKINQLIFTGEDGVLVVRGNEITLQLLLSSGVRRSQSTIPVESEVQRMLHAFRDEIISPEPTAQYLLFQKLDMNITATLEAAYSSHKYSLLTPPRSILSESEEFTSILRVSGASYFSDISLSLGAQTQWPKISADVEEAVNTQLHTDISIYGSRGVFTDFEYEFQEFHGVPNSFSLLHNSGSNALQSLYFAAQFMPGDEVIFPVYTFHATASPAMHFGIRPIFCDCDETGNISSQAIKQAITPRTKAVVITHMWGIPCDLPAILSILAEHPSILLLEDCSHAHAASINGKMVGTFGDGAAWSLQGQKIVTGGEGGIVLTKHADFHYRQLLWGHYNKRCKTEIPNNHPLQKYSLTGTGNKHRAHPLAFALALTQLRKLNSFHKAKSYFAKKMITELAEIRFLAMPVVSLTNDSTSHPAWYAMVLQFVEEKAPDNMTRDNFVAKLHEAGLEEIDTPKSTGLLHDEPLFTNPKEVLPHVNFGNEAVSKIPRTKFTCAQRLYDNAIKLPVFADSEDEARVDYYILTIKNVAKAWV